MASRRTRGGPGACVAALLLLFASAACRAPRAPVLRVLVRTPFADLGSGPTGGSFGGIVTGNSCDGLVAFDSDLRMAPALATAWSTPTDSRWRFELRKGVTFHDGRPMTAADVKHTLDRAMAQPGYWLTSRVPRVEAVRAVGDHVLEIDTTGPAPLLLNMLAEVCVVPAGHEAKPSAGLVATGPYRLRSLEAEREVVFERFDAHWRGRPYWSRAVFQFEPDGRSRLARLLAGEVDLVESPPDEGLPALAGNRVRVIEQPGVQIVVLNLDVRAAPFAEAGTRRALSLGLDRHALARDALAGRASPAVQLAPRGVFGFDARRTVPNPDRSAARGALAAASRSPGVSAPLLYTERDRRIAELVAAQVASVGIRLDLVELPWGELDRRLQAGVAPAAIYILTFPYLDASDALFDLHTRSADGRLGLFNFSGYSDPELDRALVASETELDPRKRLALLGRAMDRALDAHALIPLVVLSEVVAARPGLTWTGNGLGRVALEEIREEPPGAGTSTP
jgi:peptide/nickel transport system substrate-binding protein